MEPSLSVIIPVYNAERTLRTAIDSVIMQRCDDVEIVVVDDGSTDGSWEIIESYGDQIVALRQENAGANVARNHGARVSRGQFLKFLDADDFLFPESLRKQIEHAEGLPERSLSFGGDIYWYVNSDRMQYVQRKGRSAAGDAQIQHIIPNIPVTASFIWMKEAYWEIRGFDEQVPRLQDFDIFMRAIIAGHRTYSIDLPIYIYRQHHDPNRISRRRSSDDFLSVLAMYERHISALESGTPAYPKEAIRQGLARHVWTNGRYATRHGHDDIARRFFSLARSLHRRCVYGPPGYWPTNFVLGPYRTEALLTRAKLRFWSRGLPA